MHHSTPRPQARRLLVVSAVVLAVAACNSRGPASPGLSGATTSKPAVTAPSVANPGTPAATALVPAGSSGSQAPDTGGGTSHGDIPDNAVFLDYRGTNPAFSIKYVEGWQVGQRPDGVVIRDKDSSEAVSIVAPQADVPGYVASSDLPFLRAQTGFKLDRQDTVKIGGTTYVHLVYHMPAAADPVTGKQVPSTVDRYFVPGPNGLAIVSLSTPDGVDNVDAFRQMIESFRWS